MEGQDDFNRAIRSRNDLDLLAWFYEIEDASNTPAGVLLRVVHSVGNQSDTQVGGLSFFWPKLIPSILQKHCNFAGVSLFDIDIQVGTFEK